MSVEGYTFVTAFRTAVDPSAQSALIFFGLFLLAGAGFVFQLISRTLLTSLLLMGVVFFATLHHQEILALFR